MDKRAFLALTVTMLTIAVGVGLIVPFLPIYASELGATGIWIGLIFGINPIVSGTLTMFLGSISDRRDKRGLILFGLVGYLVVAAGFMVASSPLQLFLVRVLQGAFSAAVLPVCRAYAGELAPPGAEGRTMGLFNLAFVGGFAAGPTFGGLLWDLFGRQAPFVGMAVLTALALVLVRWFVPSRPPAKAGRRGGIDLRPLGDPHIAGNVLVRATLAIGHGVFLVLLPLVGEQSFGLMSSQIGVLVTIRAGTESVMQPVMGRVADRVDRRLQIVAFACLMPVALMLMPLVQTYTQLILVTLLFGIGGGGAMPATTAIAVDKGRRWGMGSLMGLEHVAMNAGIATGSTTSGAIMDIWSPWTAFRAAAAAGFLGVLAFSRLTRGYVPGVYSPGAVVEVGEAGDEGMAAAEASAAVAEGQGGEDAPAARRR